jgi:alpha-beta hydrolase superfamily lysophospholipase
MSIFRRRDKVNKMINKKFLIKNSFTNISGETFIPDNYNGKNVILAHGFSNDRHQRGQFDDLKKELLKKGYSVFWFDFPGTGKSGGKFEDTTLAKQREALKGVIEYVYKNKYVNKEQLGLVATSFSSVSAITLNSNRVKTYVLCSVNAQPYNVIADLFKNSYGNEKIKNIFNPQGLSIRTNGVGRLLKLKPAFWKSVRDINLRERVSKITNPKLFIHGDKDLIACYQEAKELFNSAKSPKKFITIKGAGHNYDESKKVRVEMINKILDWFNKTL